MTIKDKKIYKGNYKRYDGKCIYVVTEVADVDKQAEEMYDILIKHPAEKEKVTEQLKA